MLQKSCSVNPSKYVVLDVETNGLSSIRDDLLSISLYRPDTELIYNRFLPLEMNTEVITTQYNGIETANLKSLSPLTQEEVDEIISSFDLKNRIIITYGGLDERFITKYFQRHHLQGIEYFAFYNFKHEIISSRFSEGNITKDNLCTLFGIDNVQDIHSGDNDCVLEWKLFQCMNGHRLLVTNSKVFEFNDEYIVPASYLYSHPNLKYYIADLPKITCESKTVFSLSVEAENLKKFPTNFNGMILEHLINSMLHVQRINSEDALLENKKKLKYIGELPSSIDIVPMIFNPDGSMTATRGQDRKLVNEINSVINELKTVFKPLISFIGDSVFRGEIIKSQELVIHPTEKILALCDLSNDDAVLEIKSTRFDSVQRYAEQLYYESKGRKCFILLTNWSQCPKRLLYTIDEVSFIVENYVDPKQIRLKKAKEKIETDKIELLSYVDSKSPVNLKCKFCGNEWRTSYNIARKSCSCPNCSVQKPIENKKTTKQSLTEGEKLAQKEKEKTLKIIKYRTKIEEKSQHRITALSFTDSRSEARAKCLVCGYEWTTRADHILDRPYCPLCKKRH